MDRHFLQLMRRGTPMSQIAVEYHATYYARIGGEYDGTCMRLAEPSNAGPTSPHMRGSNCHAPLVEFYRESDHMPLRVSSCRVDPIAFASGVCGVELQKRTCPDIHPFQQFRILA